MNKKKAERIHAKRRALERYGLVLNHIDLKTISAMIKGHKACFLFRQSNRVTIWQLGYKGKDIVVVYDGKRKEIITFLPSETANMIAERRFTPHELEELSGECEDLDNGNADAEG